MTQSFEYAVFIGRFQPFHNAHLHVCKEALKKAEHLIVLVGSSTSSRSLRNPFTFSERRSIIKSSLNDAGFDGRYTILGMRDYFYSDNLWVANVQKLVQSVAGSSSVALVGFAKDSSSYYLTMFPTYKYLEIPQENLLSATNIREMYLDTRDTDHVVAISQIVPTATSEFLDLFEKGPDYSYLADEYEAMASYKKVYEESQKLLGTHPPIFHTVDAVVTCGGHVLLVVRKSYPGKGLIALPGGFLNQRERIKDACLRELKEETRIKVPTAVLKGSIAGERYFDHPDRSSRGRTITYAFHFNLMEEALPKVRGADDAKKAFWMPTSEVMSNPEMFFEDHYFIIEHFLQNR